MTPHTLSVTPQEGLVGAFFPDWSRCPRLDPKALVFLVKIIILLSNGAFCLGALHC